MMRVLWLCLIAAGLIAALAPASATNALAQDSAELTIAPEVDELGVVVPPEYKWVLKEYRYVRRCLGHRRVIIRRVWVKVPVSGEGEVLYESKA